MEWLWLSLSPRCAVCTELPRIAGVAEHSALLGLGIY